MSLVLMALVSLAQPVDVLEQWEIVRRVPTTEAVTARGLYRRADGADAVLPAAVQGPEMPTVFAVGEPRDLTARRTRDGWIVALPPGTTATVRVVSRVVRAAPIPRLFRFEWPRVVPSSAPTRHVLDGPGSDLLRASEGWTCVDDVEASLECVSSARAPHAMLWRLGPPASARWEYILALTVLLATLVGLGLLRGPDRRLRVVTACVGMFVGGFVALAVVGALRMTWAPALVASCVPAAGVGALAARNEGARRVGAACTLIVPVAAVVDGSFWHVTPLAALFAAAIIALAARRPLQRAA